MYNLEPQVTISLKEYQDLQNGEGPSQYQRALVEIVALINRKDGEGETAKEVLNLLVSHQIPLINK